MDSIKVWSAKVIILSVVSFVSIISFQIISGLTITINNQQISQIIVGNITALIFVRLLHILYYKMKSKIERIWEHSLGGFLVSALFFTLVVTAIIQNQVAYTLQGYGPVLASLFMFVAYGSTFFWLTEERIDAFLHNTILTTLTWFVAGGISAGAFTLVVNLILVTFNILLFENPLIMLGTGIVTGGVVTALSVIGREQTLGRVEGYVTMYSIILANLGKRNSNLLDSVLHGDNQEITLNPSESMEWMEYNIPWLLVYISLTVFMTFVTILNILVPPPTLYPLGPVIFFVAFICYYSFFTFKVFKHTIGKYRGYQEWRRIWSDFWDLVKLFTMSKDATAMEYTHRVSNYSLSEFSLQSQNLIERIEELKVICEVNEKVPNEIEEQKVMFVNLILYGKLKKILNEQSPIAELLENELGLRGKARVILDRTKSLIQQDIGQELAIGILYASVYDAFDIPVEMLRDIAPLLTRDWQHEPEVCAQCIDQLAVLEDTPKRIIPDSLKWLPVIFPIALWLVTIILS